MAWINLTQGASTSFSKAGTVSAGSDKYDFLYHTCSAGEFVITWDQDYSPSSAPNRYMYIYKNGSLEETVTILASISADVQSQSCSLVPCAIRANELFYTYGYRSGNDQYVRVDKYNFLSGSTTTGLSTHQVTDAGTSGDNTRSLSCGMCWDPAQDKFYVIGAGHAWDVGVSQNGILRIWQLTSSGVLDHRVINTTNYGASDRWCQTRIVALDGTVYYYYHLWDDSGSDIRRICKADGTATDTTETVTVTGPTTNSVTDYYGIIGTYGLYVKYNETTLRSQDEATTWDLSSYMDTNCHITLVAKTETTEDYVFLTEKSGTVYLITCDNAGTVTQVATKVVDSDYTQHPEVIGVGSPFRKAVDWWPRQCLIGSAKKALSFVPLTRDII